MDHFQSRNVAQSLVIRTSAKSRIKAGSAVLRATDVRIAVEIGKDAARGWKKKADNCRGEGSGASNYFREKDRPRY